MPDPRSAQPSAARNAAARSGQPSSRGRPRPCPGRSSGSEQRISAFPRSDRDVRDPSSRSGPCRSPSSTGERRLRCRNLQDPPSCSSRRRVRGGFTPRFPSSPRASPGAPERPECTPQRWGCQDQTPIEDPTREFGSPGGKRDAFQLRAPQLRAPSPDPVSASGQSTRAHAARPSHSRGRGESLTSLK